MSRGLNRTVIMSHGAKHDAVGATGTHLAGSTPEASVLDAIPSTLGVVGEVASSAPPPPLKSSAPLPGGPATSRPTISEAASAPQAASVATPAASAPAPAQDAVSAKANSEALAALKLTKRKLKRASNEALTEWCALAGINPREYVESDSDPITGSLLRRLLTDHLNIE